MEATDCSGRSQESIQNTFVFVLGVAATFLAAEVFFKHVLSKPLTTMLKRNPAMTEKKVKNAIPLEVTRFLGFIHNTVQLPIAIWAVSHPALQSDRLQGTTATSHIMLCIAAGFFLHDAVCCLLRESPFYVVHGLTCTLGYIAAAAVGAGHFYGGLFLLWELSTPFVQLRWVLQKMGLSESKVYMMCSLLMVITFSLARVVFGTVFTFQLLKDTYIELSRSDDGCKAPAPLLIGLCAAASTVSCLNYYWFNLMRKSLVKIMFGGQSWTKASEGKEE